MFYFNSFSIYGLPWQCLENVRYMHGHDTSSTFRETKVDHTFKKEKNVFEVKIHLQILLKTNTFEEKKSKSTEISHALMVKFHKRYLSQT